MEHCIGWQQRNSKYEKNIKYLYGQGSSALVRHRVKISHCNWLLWGLDDRLIEAKYNKMSLGILNGDRFRLIRG